MQSPSPRTAHAARQLNPARAARPRRTPLCRALLGALALCAGPLQAAEIATGIPDAVLRWDTTLRYNYGVRMAQRDPALLGNPNSDDGDRHFAKGDAVTNRLDLLTELDMVIAQRYGFRVSAAGWVDQAYRHLAKDKASPATFNGTGGPGTLSPYTQRFAKGPSGEWLDAFVFANTEVADTPLTMRLGRHTAYWGEGLMLGGAVHGVSYGQYALDIWKSSATPGAEAKELYRPRNGLTVQAQPATDLSLTAQVFFDWEAARLPEAGSYLAGSDALLFGGQRFFVPGVGFVARGKDVTPRKSGDFGLAARWSPDWLDGSAGLYLRRTADLTQQSWLDITAAGPRYHLSFARDIDIFGLSLSKSVAGVSLGAELSTRRHMPLLSNSAIQNNVTVTAAALNALAAQGEVPGARGNTLHALVNGVLVLPPTPLFDSASLAVELTWNRVLSVTSDPFKLYKGSAAYKAGTTAGAANLDAVTRDASTIALSFTPNWLAALPGVDLSLPFSYNTGLSGNSGVTSGGTKRVGSASLGLVADINSKYNVSLRYITAFGPYSKIPAGPFAGAAGVLAAANSGISDRDMLVLTFKTTF